MMITFELKKRAALSSAMLSEFCNLLYDNLRTRIIHVIHLETLAELVTILKVEMIEEHVKNSGRKSRSSFHWPSRCSRSERIVHIRSSVYTNVRRRAGTSRLSNSSLHPYGDPWLQTIARWHCLSREARDDAGRSSMVRWWQSECFLFEY